MKKHNINVNLSSPSNNTENAKTLFVTSGFSFSEPEWIFDSGATHNIAAHKNLFSSVNPCNTEHILMGNSSPLAVKGQGSIKMIDGIINNVLCS